MPAGNRVPKGNPELGAKLAHLSKEERKNKRGANKGRRFQKVRDDLELCWRVAVGKTCEFGAECVAFTLLLSWS